jgi:hypothetical protein
MRRAAVLVVVAVVLVGCSQDNAGPQPQDTGTVSVSPEPTRPSPVETPTTQAPTSAPVSPTPSRTKKAQPGADAFCTYLEQTQGAQQQIEDPAQFVALVEGAAAVAPGAIAEDAALYAESVRALALTVTGSPKQAAKADAWLSQNEDVIAAAEANLDSYSQSTCGLPFITGEG